jgi:conjugative relaxase-like TrwC/TraI family protein
VVSFSKALTVEHAGNYYEQHYSPKLGEYYAPTQGQIVGHAIGKGAEALGITGDITAEQFEALLRGRNPATDAALRMKANRADANERAGWDCTISPPKSISIQALVAGDTRLIEADRQAAVRAMREAEACALGRQRGGREWVQSGNLTAVMFEHYDARESLSSQHGPMPQLHHHCFLMNATQLPNGEWRSLDPDQIYKSRNAINAIYMSELARNVQQIGYSITRGSDGNFELAGYTRAQIEAFSERGQDIKRAEAQAGISNPKDARQIRLETRQAKRQHDPEMLKSEREALAAEHGIALDYRPVQPVRNFTITPDHQAERSLDFAVRHGTNRQAVIDHRELLVAALRHGVGATDLDHLQAHMKARQAGGQLIAVGSSYLHPLGRHTTPEMVRLERENLATVRQGMNAGRPIAGIAVRSAVDGKVSGTGTQEVREWAAAKKLLPDQTEAAILTLTSGHWVTAIEGLAGTAKTSLVGSIKEFAQQHGWTVRGFGTTTTSVGALEQVGIEARTVAKLRAAPLPAKTGREFWIVDESSLLATVPVNELLKLARERGVERVVFVGDQKQHLAIEAGNPVRQLMADNMAVARLTKIRRQKEPGLLQAVELVAAERIAEAVDLLIEQKRVVEIKDPAARYQRIAEEYLNAYEARQNCLVVSPANEERKAINEAVRSALVANGYVQSLGQQHQILCPRDLTDAQKQHALSYHEGDVIYFRRGSQAQQIPRRAYLTVTAVHDENLTLRAENGRLISFDPSRWKGLNVYTAETRTIAVGDRLQWREPDHKRRIANGKYATVTALDRHDIEVRFDHNRKLSMPLSDARKVDLGYCSTSHKSQGSTVHKVIINIDSSRHAELVNDRQFYVSATRPEWDARIYTDSVQGMRRAVARRQEKTLALDVVAQQRRQQPTAMRI